MNWASVDFDWNQARAFLVAATEGSFSAAALHLKQTQPTLSRQVAALEEFLEVTLFERVGRRLILTETGHQLLAHVREMADAAGLVTLKAAGHSDNIAGEVRISAGETVSAYLLPTIVGQIGSLFPDVKIHLVVSNLLSDLLRREADIAIRHVRPEQQDLVAKKVRDSSAHLYASSDWVQRHGRPQEPQDLENAHFVGSQDNQPFVQILQDLGVAVSLKNFKWTTGNQVVSWELVKQGLGIGGMLREVAAATPNVEQLLPGLAPIAVPYWLCAHREVHTSRRIRAVFDVIASALQASEGRGSTRDDCSQES